MKVEKMKKRREVKKPGRGGRGLTANNCIRLEVDAAKSEYKQRAHRRKKRIKEKTHKKTQARWRESVDKKKSKVPRDAGTRKKGNYDEKQPAYMSIRKTTICCRRV